MHAQSIGLLSKLGRIEQLLVRLSALKNCKRVLQSVLAHIISERVFNEV